MGREGEGEKKGEGRNKGSRGKSVCVVRGCKMATQMALGRKCWAMKLDNEAEQQRTN